MNRFTIVLIGAALFFVLLGLSYVLPQVSVVEVVGVEVKRTDVEQGTHDVYLIQTQLIDGGAVRVFRNEDALLYLKFDSATLQARVTGLSRGQGTESVAVRHYGWRIPVLSMFPNAISAWPVEPSYRHLPLFNIVVVVLLLLTTFSVWRAVRRVRAKVAAAIAQRARDAAKRSVPSIIDAGHEDWLVQDRPSSGRPDDLGRGS